MKTFELDSSVWLPVGPDELFPFFADARNLERITPPWLRFSVLTPGPIQMQRGTRIDYRLRWHGIPLRWRSEIAEWDPPHRFVDRQLRGPYRMWQHLHTFVEDDGGTRVTDHVRYAVPGGWLVQRLVVGRDVAKIFGHRRSKLQEIFGTISR